MKKKVAISLGIGSLILMGGIYYLRQPISLTIEEPIKFVSEVIEEEVTLEEVRTRLASDESIEDGYSYHEMLSIQDFGNERKVEAGVLYRKEVATGKIDLILETWTQPHGNQEFIFLEAYHTATINESQNTIRLHTRGTVEVKRGDYYERETKSWSNVSATIEI